MPSSATVVPSRGRMPLAFVLFLLSTLALVAGIGIHVPGDLSNQQCYIDQSPCNPESWPENWPNPPEDGVCTPASAPDPSDTTCPVHALCTIFVPDLRSSWVEEWMPFVPLLLVINGTVSDEDETLCTMRIHAVDRNGNPVILRTIWETDDTSIARERVTEDFDHLQTRGLGAHCSWPPATGIHGHAYR